MTPVESSRGSSDRCDGPRSSGTCSSSASSPRASAPRTTSRRSSGCASKRTRGPSPGPGAPSASGPGSAFPRIPALHPGPRLSAPSPDAERNQFLRSSPYFPGLPSFLLCGAKLTPIPSRSPGTPSLPPMSRPPRSWSGSRVAPSHPPSPRNRRGGPPPELCGDLVEGGITPSLGMLTRVRERTALPTHVLIRPGAVTSCSMETNPR